MGKLAEFERLKYLLSQYAKKTIVEVDQTELYYLSFKPDDEQSVPEIFAAIHIHKGAVCLIVDADKAAEILSELAFKFLTYYYSGNGGFRFPAFDKVLEPGLNYFLKLLYESKK